MRELLLRAGMAVALGLGIIWGDSGRAAEAPPPEPAEVTDEPVDAPEGPVSGGAATAAATASTEEEAQESGGSGRENLDVSTGAFAERIAIDVPPFRGLEPSLALSYGSNRDNGFVGVGWRLDGLSVIERASIRSGAPRYDSSDVFQLDGDELIECAGISSPGCGESGGTHATRFESYLRIKQDTASNTWEVTSRQGTKLTYQPLGVFAGGDQSTLGTQFRWLLASVVDTHGNTVLYGYDCDPLPTCYVETITYNGNTITFFRETRSDPVTYAAGVALGTIDQRLKTIDVQVGGQRVRTYALSYATGTSTSRSRLVAVEQYGRDAEVDGAGTISGGTSLPPVTLAYSEGANAFVSTDWMGTQGQGNASGPGKFKVGDFNGDGRGDFVSINGNGGCTSSVWLSTGSAFTQSFWAGAGCSGSGPSGTERLADVNGDGKTDLVIFPYQTTSNAVFLSNGTDGFVFQTWPNQGTAGALASNGEVVTGDFNGDGKTDFAQKRLDVSASCTIHVKLADDNAFTEELWSVGPTCPSTSDLTDLQVGDFNGDGKSDFVKRIYASGNITAKLFLSTGSGFTTHSWAGVPNGNNNSEKWPLADVNGDGLTDMIEVWYSNGTTHADPYLSTGTGFAKQTGISASSTVLNFNHAWVPADVNGDGRADLTLNGNRVLLSTGSSYLAPQTWISGGSARPVFADFSGDGRDDFAQITSTTTTKQECSPGGDNRECWTVTTTTYHIGKNVRVSDGAFPDLLTGITNSLGGTTAVQYTPSSAWPVATSAWPSANPPFVVQTVSSITADDGRGTASQTTYTYSGGLWNQAERRFLGFKDATTTLPLLAEESQPPKIETTFAQSLACAGGATVVKQMDGAGTVLRQTENTFADNSTTVPYTCLATETTSTVNVGGASRSAKVTRTFDSYGNVTQATRHGDLAVSGDEITAEAVYQPNETDYIVSLPARVRVHEGTSTGGTKLTESFVYYDGNTTDWQTPPVKGDATRTQAWLDTTGGFVTSNAAYDSYGNVTSQSDPLGNTTTLIYDPTYHLFVTEARDPLYPTDSRHKTTATWDFVCGLPTETRDLNDLPTTTEYDALCRPRKVTTPSGAFACTNYLSLGSPTAQHIETQTVPPTPESPTACSATSFTAGANLWSRTYLDGFGRTYRAAAEGPGGTQTAIEALTAYNARGGVASATAPFYTGDPRYTTEWKYDALDRKIEKKHPDNNKLLQSFGLSTIPNGFETAAVTDELLRPHTIHTDAHGRTIRTDRLLGGTTVKTEYQYDLLDLLTGITDHAGNQWTYTYDSLGRRIAVSDPDLGDWSYLYDAAGRLTDQTDAKGQVTHLTYDALGRVLTKTARYGTPQAETTTYVYDQHRVGYYNVGHQTTASNAAATIEYNFDQEGRQVAKTYTVPGVTPGTYTFTAAFDLGGRLLRQAYPDGDTIGTTADPIIYDAAGRLKTVPNLITQPGILYDARGNPTNVTRQNGATTVMTYVPERGWLDTLVTSSTAGSIQNLDYSRDALGRITSVTSPEPGESWVYGYDDLDRLISADNATDNSLDQTFQYDLVGNMIYNSQVGTYSYPAPGSTRPHAVTGISGGPLGSQSFTYDANGSMTVQGPDIRTYDGENRLVGATDGGTTTAFVYGPDGARMKKTANGTTTLYFGDDVEVIPGASPQYTKYLPGDAKRVGLSTTTWLHRDHLRSVRAITDAAGAILDRADYRPFGEQLGFATADESKGYIGERHDAETGLMYLHARYYDPVLARFVQADPSSPMVPGVGVNRYAYGLNNPVVHLDPSGLWALVDDGVAIVGGALVGVAAQGIADAINGDVSSWRDYAAAAIGGAVAGEAALYTGGLAAGAAGGIAYSVTDQLLNDGTIDGEQLASDTVVSAVTGGLGKYGLVKAVKSLVPNGVKGMIGDFLSRAANTLRGSTLVATQQRIPGLRTIADSVWRRVDDVVYYVESKFGTSGLTRAQRAAKAALGALYKVEKWTYDFVGKVGAIVGYGIGTVINEVFGLPDNNQTGVLSGGASVQGLGPSTDGGSPSASSSTSSAGGCHNCGDVPGQGSNR